MKPLAYASILLLGPVALVAEGRPELDILRARCTEQERQIRTLETEIESLHSQLALERQRARGIEPSIAAASPVDPAPAATYTVKVGDTLSSIARRYHTSAEALMKGNGIADPTRLRSGQQLSLPAQAKVPAPAPADPAAKAQVVEKPASQPTPAPAAKPSDTYQVRRGDTLYGIARKHKLTMAGLRSLNPKIGDKIIIGQDIAIGGKPSTPGLARAQTKTIALRSTSPDPDKPAAKTASAKKPAPVKKTETAPKPAAKATPVAETKKNKAPGTVTEPTPAPKTISSIIVMDEISFGAFAEKHGTTPKQLNALNGWDFKSNLVLARGSEIYVPGQ